MTSKTNTISILIVTLLIGMLIGGALVGRIVKVRVDRFQNFTTEQGFVDRYSEFIGEMTNEQRAAVLPILQQSGGDVEGLMRNTRSDFSNIIDRVETELSAHLTSEQLNALKERRQNYRDQIESRRGR